MKRIYSILFVWMIALSAWAQSGEGYDPENPADPTVCYILTMEATPRSGGSVDRSRVTAEAGQTVYCHAYAKVGYAFKQWMIGDSLVSTESSFSYTMPAHDVVLIAYFEYEGYNPENPDDPFADGYEHNVTLYATPSVGGYFNSASFMLTEGEVAKIYAYPRNGYRFESWMQGSTVVSTDNPLTIRMGTQDVGYKAVFAYNPENPADPFANTFNKETGEVVIDNFMSGSLNSALSNAIGGMDYSSTVKSIKVIGKLNPSDFGFARHYTNCETIDLSRTTGYVEVPSYSFESASALKTIYLPTNVEAIGKHAFMGCSALKEFYIYSPIPPTLGEEVFYNTSTDMTVYVPSGAVELYRTTEGWKNLSIKPLDGEEYSFTVNFPSNAVMSEYKNMTLELVNVQSGQVYKYLVTDRHSYTFYALMKNTIYDVFLKNAMGEALAELSNIMLDEKDVNISFTTIKKMYDVALTVLTPEGDDVTSKVDITWYDNQGTYLRQGSVMKSIVEGRNLQYRIKIDGDLALEYAQPMGMNTCVADENGVVHKLSRLEKIDFTGRIVDANTKRGLRNATVSLSQAINKSNNKTQTVKTDEKGYYSLIAYNAPYKLSVSAYDYVTQAKQVDTLTIVDNKVEIPHIMLSSIIGATINISHTYVESAEEGVTPEIINWYKDYDNIAYDVYNVTLAKQIAQASYRYPQLVLLDDAQVGDSLQITATSKKEAFMPVVVGTTIDSTNVIDAIFDIKQLGQIKATYKTTENPLVTGILYSNEGQLLNKYTYSQGELRIDELKDGTYYLVTMGKNERYNSPYNISRLLALGLMEDVDYIKEEIVVESGLISTVSCDEVPFFDENKFNYIEMGNSSLYASQSSIVVGNYVTLVGSLDVIGDLEELSELKFMVDLPSTAAFVDGSVMIGETVTSNYTFEGGTLTIPLNGYKQGDKIKFCIVPTEGGEYTPDAFITFVANERQIALPMGNSYYRAEALTINVPPITASKTITVSGVVAEPKSVVEIYDNDVLIASVTPMANGDWTAKCELNEAYNLSTHKISAKVTTEARVQYESEIMTCEYDMNAIIVDKVTMYYNSYKNVFDFINPTSKAQTYSYSSDTGFTFTVEFNLNDTTKISNVVLYVKTMKNEWFPLYPKYDVNKRLWVTSAKSSELGNSYPVNVSVDYLHNSVLWGDPQKLASELNEVQVAFELWKADLESLDSTLNNENITLKNSDIYDELENLLSQEKYDADRVNVLLELLKANNPDYTESNLELPNETDYEKERIEVNMLYSQLITEGKDSLLASLLIYEDLFDGEFCIEPIAYESEGGEYKLIMSIISSADERKLTQEGYVSLPMTDSTVIWCKISSDSISFIDPIREIEITKVTYNNNHTRSINISRALDNIPTTCIDAAQDLLGLLRDDDSVEAWRSNCDVIKSIMDGIACFYELVYNNATKTDILDNLKILRKSEVERYNAWLKLISDKRVIPASYVSHLRDLEKSVSRIDNSIGEINKFLNGPVNRLINRLPSHLTENLPRLDNTTRTFGRVAGGFGILLKLYDTYCDCRDFIDASDSWTRLRNRIENKIPCIGNEDKALELKKNIIAEFNALRDNYIRIISADVIGIAADAASLKVKHPIGALGLYVGSIYLGLYTELSKSLSIDGKFLKKRIHFAYEVARLRCDKKDPEPSKDEGGKHKPQTPDSKPSIDPAGYVYEGVSSNRIEGVMASCYYKETEEDEYGIIQDRAVLWDAEEYAQENPLFTDENGMYQWFVPQGLWQVKFEKEGYETTYSEWLPVPPPQLEVNIPLVQNKQPEVKTVHAYKDGIVVEFDKYMQPATLNTDNIFVVQNGEKVAGTVTMLNEEIAYRDSSVVYVSKVRFVYDQSITAEEVTLTVSNRVKSYAGLQMQDTYTQTFDIEKEIKAIVTDSLVTMYYGGEYTLTVKAQPAEAAAGKTLMVSSLSPMILTVDTESIVLDNNGEAAVKVYGELPGTATVNYSIAGYDYAASTIVKVESEDVNVTANPTASIASGTTIEKGTEVTLYCATEGAVIYYTLDGSCPCDESALQYDGTPIVINEDTELRIMAVAEGRDESDVVVYYYYVKEDVRMTANPTASIASGTTVEKGTEVTLNCTTEGAVIYYTLDGSSPQDKVTQYNGTPIIINNNTELRIMAVAEGYSESDVVVYYYYVEGDVKMTANPTASIASGTTVEKGTEVTLSCATEGAIIYYTLDGSSPLDEDTQIRYDGTPIVINEDTELRIMAVAEGYAESYVVTYYYYIAKEEEPALTEVNIFKKWDDVLICDNSAYELVAYQWYKDDMPIEGETNQYYSEEGGLNGSYYVMAKDADGNWGKSNTIICQKRNNSRLKVTPTVVKKNEKCMVTINRSATNGEVVYLNVFNAVGQMIREIRMYDHSIELEFDNSGPYFIKAVELNGNMESEKIIVIE